MMDVDEENNSDVDEETNSIQDIDKDKQPTFKEFIAIEVTGKLEFRRIRCPAHRYSPLRNDCE